MKRVSVARYLFISTVLGIVIASATISYIWIHISFQDMRQSAKAAERLYLQGKINLIKQELNSILHMIDTERRNTVVKIKSKLTSRTYLLYEMAYSIFNSFKNRLPQASIEKHIVKSISDLNPDDPSQTILIVNRHNRIIFSSTARSGGYFQKKLPPDEGFVTLTYHSQPMLAYSKLFEPFGWHIVVMKSIESIDRTVASRIKWELASLSYRGKSRKYLFVAEVSKDGKCFAREIVDSAHPASVGRCLFRKMEKAVSPDSYKKYLMQLKQQGEVLIEYTSKASSRKSGKNRILYMVLYKPLNWVVGSGMDLQGISSTFFSSIKNNFENQLPLRLASSTAISVAILALFALAYVTLYSLFKKDTDVILDFFEKYPEKTSRIELKQMRTTEAAALAEHINRLSDRVTEFRNRLMLTTKRYLSLARFMPDCLIILNKTDNAITVKDINPAAERFLNKRRDDVIHKPFKEVFPELQSLFGLVEKAFYADVPSQIPITLKESNGELRYYSCTIYRLGNSEVVLIARDSTETIKLINRVKEEQEKLSEFINAVNIGVVVVTKEADILYINKTAREILEIGEDKVEKKELIKLIGVNTFREIRKKFSKTMPFPLQVSNVKVTTPGGKDKWLDVTVGTVVSGNEMMIVISFYDITSRYLKEKEVEYLSFHDYLTNLYNRLYFEEELKKLFSKRRYPLALVLCDMNGLKIVNDILGHKKGDELLKKAARVLLESSRSTDIVARIGGDEFAVVMPHTDSEGAEAFINRVNRKIRELNNRGEIYLSLAFGYSIQNGQFTDINELFLSADADMYKNKFSNRRDEDLKKVLSSAHLLKRKLYVIDNRNRKTTGKIDESQS